MSTTGETLNQTARTYSRDTTVAAVSAFYRLVNRAQCNGNLVFPPSDGWPQLTLECLRPLGKTDTVVELLRHLPYFTNGETFFIMDHTSCINYLDKQWLNSLSVDLSSQNMDETKVEGDNEEGEEDEGQPAHIVCIARSNGRYGYDIYIDTERGTVIWDDEEGNMYRPASEWGDMQPLDDPWSEENEERAEEYEELGEDDPLEWRRAPTWRVETFFKMCTDNVLELRWLPSLDGEGWIKAKHEPTDEERRRQAIMRDCGWPAEDWDKEKARREMAAHEEV